MSVLIKGMEMPKNCKNCPMLCDYFCRVANCEPAWGQSGRDATCCPLIPVPPHGRLIDGDRLLATMSADPYGVIGHTTERDRDILMVRGMPAIIPAEGEEEE